MEWPSWPGPIARLEQSACLQCRPSPARRQAPGPPRSGSLILPCQRRSPGDQPGLVPALLRPSLLIARDLQALDQAGQLAVLEQVMQARPCMAKQVRPGGVDQDQAAAGCQHRPGSPRTGAARGTGRRRPGPTGPAARAPAPGRSPGFSIAPPRHSPRPGPGQSPTGETSATVTSSPRPRQPDGIRPVAAGHIQGQPMSGQLALQGDQERQGLPASRPRSRYLASQRI